MGYELDLLKGDLCPQRETFLYGSEFKLFQKAFNQAFIKRYSEYIKDCQRSGIFPHFYRKPLGLQFELSHKCNLRCVHCYNDSSGQTDVLTVDDWKKLAGEAVDMGVLECVISGGEPTIYPCLWDVLDILHEGGIRISLITNGLTMTRELAGRLAVYEPNWVQISCDGFEPKSHDGIRGRRGSWSHVIQAARHLASENIPVVMAHTVFRKNLESLGNLIDLAGCLGCAQILIGEALPIGRGSDDAVAEEIIFSKEEQERFFEIYQKKAAEWEGIMIVSFPMPPSIGTKLESIEPNQVMLIRPDGDVRLSCISPFVVGNVTESPLQEIWESCKTAYTDNNVRGFGDEIENSDDLRKSSYGVAHSGKQMRLFERGKENAQVV